MTIAQMQRLIKHHQGVIRSSNSPLTVHNAKVALFELKRQMKAELLRVNAILRGDVDG
jgi:hypothetical protein